MILATLERSARYTRLHPGFARAFEVLAANNLQTLEPGRHPIDGERIYISIDHKNGRGRDGARLEAHQRYLDVQLTIEGEEEIGWMPLADCREPLGSTHRRMYNSSPTVQKHVGRCSSRFLCDLFSGRCARAARRTWPSEESDREDRD
jgi:hypothetical protein